MRLEVFIINSTETESKTVGALKVVAYVLAGMGIALNGIGIAVFWNMNKTFDVVIHSTLTILGIALIFAIAITQARRIISPAALVFIATVVALIHRAFPEPTQDAAAIFGISAFVWLVLEKFYKY